MPPTANWTQNATTVAGLSNGTSGSLPFTLYANKGISISNDGILYIADSQNNRVVVVGPDSTSPLAIIQNTSNSQPIFKSVDDIAVTQNYIYVLDTISFVVIRLFRNGTNPMVFAGIKDNFGDFTNTSLLGGVYNIFADSKDNLYVVMALMGKVLRFPSNSVSGTRGTLVAGDGTPGSGPTQLMNPQGIFVTDAGTVYVTDSLNNRIQKWTKGVYTGVTVAGNGVLGSNETSLFMPLAVAVDSNEYVYILESGLSRILRWPPGATAATCIAACFGSSGPFPYTLSGPFTFAFDSYGSIYASDTYNNRVQKFRIQSSLGK